MNEIKKCSISGISFIFEKVAYNRLSNYIDSLRRAYKTSSESDEIIADIEARIAELILSAQSDPSQVVCLPLIENIIAQLGSAEDIAGSEEQNSAEIPTTDTRIARRMFRDLENNKLGGVCAGLGKYFNIDPVWIRLAIFAPLILLPISNISYHLRWMDNLGGNLFLVMAAIYLVLWLVIPEAKSAREKLEMDGEQVTARAIADRHEATTDEQAAKSSIATFIAWFGKVAVVMLKLFVAMIVFVLVIICGALIAAMFATTMGLGGAVIELGNLGALADLISFIGVGTPILAILSALLPAVVLIYLFVSLIMNHRPKWWVLIGSLIVWIMLWVALAISAVKGISNIHGDEVERILKSDWSDARTAEPLDTLEYNRLLTDPNVESID